MSNQYRAHGTAGVAAYGADVVDLELDRWTEDDLLRSGVLELVPRPYRVLVDTYSVDGVPVPEGEVIEAAYQVEIEAALVDGGVLERCRRDAHATVELGEQSDPTTARRTRTRAAAKASPASPESGDSGEEV